MLKCLSKSLATTTMVSDFQLYVSHQSPRDWPTAANYYCQLFYDEAITTFVDALSDVVG